MNLPAFVLIAASPLLGVLSFALTYSGLTVTA